jgi:imidazoleglycerol phosphate synthase glutamine amidotransferase subunit HisH
MATQFHPEKSGSTGLRILKTFLEKYVCVGVCVCVCV